MIAMEPRPQARRPPATESTDSTECTDCTDCTAVAQVRAAKDCGKSGP